MTMSELNADIATITYNLTFLVHLLQHRVTLCAFECYILNQSDCRCFFMFARNYMVYFLHRVKVVSCLCRRTVSVVVTTVKLYSN